MNKERVILTVLLILLILLIQLSMFVGKYPITLDEYVLFMQSFIFDDVVIDKDKLALLNSVILEIRLPRILAAIMIGASLAVAGSTYQAMFVNPLVSPGLLGVLAGASFGAALGMVLKFSWFGIQLSTFFFGFLAVIVALSISYLYINNRSMIILILGGVISSSLFSALLSILKYTADPYDTLPAIVYWLMGSLSFSSKDTIYMLLIPMAVGIAILLLFSKYLNALSLGDEEAKSLGVNVKMLKLIMIFSATFISALTVVLAGVIGWVGLIVPHIARLFLGADNRIMIPASALIGALFLLATDDLSRTLFTFEVPIGILTSLVGIPIFVIVLRNARKGF